MLDAANRQAHTQNQTACRNNAMTQNGALIGAHAVAYYCLDQADTVNTRWTPQGISGTEDAQPGAGTVDGHRAIVFSWHSGSVGSQGTGTRLSFLDRATNRYIHVLLVRPNSTGTDYSDVSTHAGGIVWYRHYIFVTGPTSGVRVFDTNYLLRLANNPRGNISPTCPTGLHNGRYCGRGYHYLLPEIGRWNNQRAGTRYDSMSLERAPGRNPVFLTSEYRTNSVGRVARWTSAAMTRFRAPSVRTRRGTSPSSTSRAPSPAAATTSTRAEPTTTATWSGPTRRATEHRDRSAAAAGSKTSTGSVRPTNCGPSPSARAPTTDSSTGCTGRHVRRPVPN
ncbi:hypothetical protein [Streptomyces thermoalcalitolerans]|uniref:Uncharacterized protein n=1 Tax=Streptomyces thermoalcalitolerans TaxID=65605 RepID=A0ABP4A281_9ACTN